MRTTILGLALVGLASLNAVGQQTTGAAGPFDWTGQLSAGARVRLADVRGDVRITAASGDHIVAAANGNNFAASLSLTTHGNKQSVAIQPQGTSVTEVSIALNKQ